MRFVETKTPEQQSCLMLHRTRHLFIRHQTAVINAIRAHLAEFGIVAPVGRNGVEQLLDVVADPSDERVPEVARACLIALGAQLRMNGAVAEASVTSPLSAVVAESGKGCAFYGAAFGELLRYQIGFEGAMIHERCRSLGDTVCQWRGTHIGGYE